MEKTHPASRFFKFYAKQKIKLTWPNVKEGDGGKRSNTLSEVKVVENISKNLQSFLEIRSVQKEVLSHKLQDHA